MAYFLTLLRVEVKLVKAFMKELVGADYSLLKLGEFFRELELLDVGERPRWGSRGPDVGRCLKKFHVGEFYDKK